MSTIFAQALAKTLGQHAWASMGSDEGMLQQLTCVSGPWALLFLAVSFMLGLPSTKRVPEVAPVKWLDLPDL
jgi:hypothetical protein